VPWATITQTLPNAGSLGGWLARTSSCGSTSPRASSRRCCAGGASPRSQTYAIDDEGTILDARIVPPTSQNQGRIEQSLHGFVQQHVELADDELHLRCEQAVRSYDPCISCATHFLRLEIDRG
jgi:sulfhydrogenase subunit alpha